MPRHGQSKEKKVKAVSEMKPLFLVGETMQKSISRTDIENAINQWIVGRNAERDRRILYRRLIDGIYFEPLAEEFDMSVRQIKRIVYKGSDIVFSHL